MNRRPPFLVRLSAATLVAAAVAGCGASRDPASVMETARASMAKQDLRAAEIALKDLIQSGKDDANARLLLAEVHARGGDHRSAEKEIRRALEMGADREIAGPRLLEALLQGGQADKVIPEAAALALTSPVGQAEAFTAVARARLGQRKLPEAEAAFRQALDVKGDHVPAQAGLVTLQAIRGDRAGAREALSSLLAKSPDSPDLLSLKGDLDLADEKLADARDAFSRAFDRQPNNVPLLARLIAVHLDLKELDAAKGRLQTLGKLAPNTAGLLYLSALHQLRAGDAKAAGDTIQQALRGAPGHLPSVALAATIALSQGNNEQAERLARTLQEAAPNAPQGARLLATTYLRTNRPGPALNLLRPLIERGSADATTYALAGEAALRLNDAARATQYFEKAAEIDPADPAKRTGLAMSRFAGGDRDRGFAELEQASRMATDSHQADLALVMARLRAKEFDKALEAVDRLEKKLPKAGLPANLRGTVLLARNDAAGARAAFARALEIDPGFFPAAANLAALDLRDGKADAARGRYESVLKANPKNVQALVALARLTAGSGGSREQVLALLQRAQDAEPGTPEPAMLRAAYLLERKEPREAATVLQQALATNPDRIDLFEMLAQALAASDQRSQALETLDRALRAKPDDAALHLRVGQRKLALKDGEGGIAALRKAVQLQPQAAEPQIALAGALAQDGKGGEARAVAATLRRQRPNDGTALVLEGDINAIERKWADAADAYRRALSQRWNGAVFGRMYQMQLQAGRAAEADAALRTALRDRPDDVGLRLFAGDMNLVQKKFAAAAEHYRTVVEKDARNPLALNNLAWSLHQAKDPDARQYAEKALALAPKSPAIIDTLGVILSEQGQAAKGVELLRQAVALAPTNPDHRFHLVQALARNGDKQAARSELDALLKDTPSGPVADAARAFGREL